MRGLLASFVVAVALLAVVHPRLRPGPAGPVGSVEHHRRQAAGATAMRADERVARLHHPLVPLIRRAEGRFDRLEVLSESWMRESGHSADEGCLRATAPRPCSCAVGRSRPVCMQADARITDAQR